MKGTEKQIKWAEDIKAQTIRNIKAAIAANESIGMYELESELYGIMIEAVEVTFEKVNDAAKIINNRHLFYMDTIEGNVRRAENLINSGKLTVEQFAKANGVNR